MLRDDLKRSLDRRDIGSLLVSGVIGIFIGLAFISHDDPVVAVTSMFLASYSIGVILHELAHAVACKLCRGTVHAIELGERFRVKPWLEFRFAGFPWRLFSVPFSGRVYGSFYSERYYRFRDCTFICAGPLANVLLLAAGWYASSLPVFQEYSPEIAAWSVANCLLLYYSLVPFRIYGSGELRHNDALLFFRCLRIPDADIKVIVDGANMARATATDPSALDRWTLSELWQKHTTAPQNLTYLSCLVAKFNILDDDRYLDCVLKLIEHPGLPKTYVAPVIDQFLTWQLNHGPCPRPDVAEDLSRRLIALEDSISTQGTRGATLVDLGRIDEGKVILEGVLQKTESSFDRVYSYTFLALAAKAQGDTTREQALATKAKEIDPVAVVLRRLEG